MSGDPNNLAGQQVKVILNFVAARGISISQTHLVT